MAAINSGTVELLDHPRLLAQLCNLERRVARGGRDSIDHAPGGHDYLINTAAIALVRVLRRAPSRAAVPVALTLDDDKAEVASVTYGGNSLTGPRRRG